MILPWLSEPKNFRHGDDPAGVTVVCAEVAYWKDDEVWAASPEQLAELVMGTLEPYGFVWPNRGPSVSFPLFRDSLPNPRGLVRLYRGGAATYR